jgi:UDP-glucose 4-epimerase
MTNPHPGKVQTILITGASGFIGRARARPIGKQPNKVNRIDRIPSENAPLADLQRYEQIELPNQHLIRLLADWQPDVLIHCAGRASVPAAMQDPQADFRDGPVLTFELLEALRQNLPECAFILLSSAAVYGNPSHLPVSEDAPIQPVSAYGYHKWQSEMICAEFAIVFGLRTASARVFSAYGPGLRRQVIWDIVYKALTQPEIRLQGTGQESRDFIHVQDIARGLESILMNAPLHGEGYNLASGVETRIADLAKLILHEIGNPPPLAFSGELPPGIPKNWRADIKQIRRLGFQPQVALDDGISNFVAWSRNEIQGV